jgi:hypothetical protein
MEPQIEFGDWVEIEGNYDTICLPADIVGKLPDDFAARVEAVRKFIYSTTIYNVTVRKGWGARFSAPGYLDCTEWSVFDTKEEAEEYIESLMGDDYDD